jgi:hypothetical protein
MVGEEVAGFKDLLRTLRLGGGDEGDIDSPDPWIVDASSSLAEDATERESGGVIVCDDAEVPLDDIGLDTRCSSSGTPSHPVCQL